ncbi:MAG: hypothetical protein A2987_00390 [Omnitrophica bacterium RIFCSPLOWO2_01_FULL_45_10]|nr:MAG: hypothetical protein A2987_00390 [Omnitrophica bacterium RIFCSPLOWO2_01_FULL_45_10]
MKILFCQNITYPFIGIMSISAVLKEHGHKTGVKIFNISRPSARDLSEIEDFKPEILAFPVYTGWEKSVIEFCKNFKKYHEIITILGGPHPTYCPEVLANDGIDHICVGEGEASFLRFVTSLQNGVPVNNIPGIWYKKDGAIVENGISELPDINSLPPMDVDVYCESSAKIKELTHREFSLNRGCPYRCTYCNEPSLHKLYGGRNVRSKTPENAVKEILRVYNKYPFKSCAFTSDNFFLSRPFLLEFLEIFKARVNVPFYCQMRVELVTPEIARLLKEANCHMVTIGIESGSSRIRKDILGREMNDDNIIKASRCLQAAGISINTNNMVGMPSEDIEEAWDTVLLNAKIKPTTTWCSIFQPYPKSELSDSLIAQGLITREDLNGIPSSYFKKSILTAEKMYQFINLHRLFYLAVKHPKFAFIIKHLVKTPPPLNRIYDIFFFFSFCTYVKNAYRKSFLSAFKTTFFNAMEALGS